MFKVKYSGHEVYNKQTIYYDKFGECVEDIEYLKSEGVGQKVTLDIEVVEFTDEEYENIPEFTGW
jgi:hypothetical protein